MLVFIFQPIFDALEETIYHLRCQLRDKEWELRQMRRKIDSYALLRYDFLQNNFQLLLVQQVLVFIQLIPSLYNRNSSKICAQCKPEVQNCLSVLEQDCGLSTPVKSSTPLV